MNDAMFYIVIFVVSLFVLGFYAFYVKIIKPLIEKKNSIKEEMLYSHGRERDYWKRELKKFYISCIPIIGKLISRRIR